jgi:serralysin
MADYDQGTNTYTLGQDEEEFTMPADPAGGVNASVVGNDLDNLIIGNAGDNTIDGGEGADYLGGADGNDSLIGGAHADILVGGIGTDTLDGGTGEDLMAGGADADVYIVDDANDEIYEEDEEGIDTVLASVSFSLASEPIGYFVEDLVLQGTSDLTGTGNALDNHITGNSGNNTLDGGMGADELTGAASATIPTSLTT